MRHKKDIQEYNRKPNTHHADNTNSRHADHAKQKNHEKSNGVDLSIKEDVNDDEFEVY